MFDDKDTSLSPKTDPDLRATVSMEQAQELRRNGVRIGFDPTLQSWVRLDRIEDRTRPMLSGTAPTGQITLRPWTPSDAPRYAALLDDPDVWRHLYEPYPDPMTEALARDLIEIAAAAHHVVRAVDRGGEAVGQIRLMRDASGREAELSYWLGRAYWGKGLARPMVRAALDLGFRGPSAFSRIVAFTHPENVASQKVLESCGFLRVRPRGDGWLAFALDRG
jgi:RimJ/RimL family protein N-acetyltransferase